MTTPVLTVAVPDQEMADRLAAQATGVDFVAWTIDDEPLDRHLDLLVLKYMGSLAGLPKLRAADVSLLQGQSLGYDGVADLLPPGVVYCNAVGVHEGSTAELTLGLILSAQRGLYEAAVAQQAGTWRHEIFGGLAMRSVLLIGVGGVGSEIRKRLEPFDVSLTRVARTARSDEFGDIHAFDDLDQLLPESDIVVLAVPLSDETRHLADAAFMAKMKRGALLVNISRGSVVDTGALVTALQSGSIRAALDVTDPEPLPDGHPLWSAPGVVVTPHIGGHSETLARRIDPVVLEQVRRLQQGEPPLNVVLGS